jgi:hypothetical protein
MVNGFSFNSNFFVAVNDEQKPDDNGNPNPPVSGVDIVPWVLEDFQYTPNELGPTGRAMGFNIYNVGARNALASEGSGYAYLYYNAYDANDYGVVFYDYLANEGNYKDIFEYNDQVNNLSGLIINANIPAGSSLGKELFSSDTLYRTYAMPNLNGTYYLVVFGDVTDEYEENDESNNLFYTTSQEPITFIEGVGGRRDVHSRFLNPLKSSQLMSKEAGRFRSAVNANHRNAYTPEEIITFLKKERKKGRLSVKVAAARQMASKKISGYSLRKRP